MYVYDIDKNEESKKRKEILKPVDSRCLYVDEIIETRFLDEEHIVFCSNGESLKLMNIESG